MPTTEKALMLLAQAAIEQTENPQFPVDLAKLLMREQRYQQALELISSLPRELAQHEEIQQLAAHLDFIVAANNALDQDTLLKVIDNHLDYCVHRYTLVARKLLQDDYDGALAQLLEIERISPDYANGHARKGMSAIFAILGESSELVAKYRRLLIEQS
jgi:putative thioredoxin